MRLRRLTALLALLLVAPLGAQQQHTIAWDLGGEGHDGATWEVEAPGGAIVPCGDVQVLSTERRCTAVFAYAPGQTIRLRGTNAVGVGAWSGPATGGPGGFTIRSVRELPGGVPPLAISNPQDLRSDGSDPAVITLQALNEHDLAIAWVAERSGGSAANHTITGSDGNAWTKIGTGVTETDTDTRRSFSMWYRLGVSGETGNHTVSADDGTSNAKSIIVRTFRGDAGERFSLLDHQYNWNGTTKNATSIGTGSTGSVSSQNVFAAVGLMFKSGGTQPTVGWSDSYADAYESTWGSFGRFMNTAWKVVEPGSGTFSATATITNAAANDGLMAGVVVFSTTAPSAATSRPPQQRRMAQALFKF